jgi:hypothetical protein
MKLPRISMNLRTLMLGVLIFGLLFGLIAWQLDRQLERQRRRASIEALVIKQYEVTEIILRESEADAHAFAGSLKQPGTNFGGRSGGGSASVGEGWSRELLVAYDIDGNRRKLIDLDLRGDSPDLRLVPIVIEDRSGDLNAKILERLCRAYREKGWPYRIIPVKIAPTNGDGRRISWVRIFMSSE